MRKTWRLSAEGVLIGIIAVLLLFAFREANDVVELSVGDVVAVFALIFGVVESQKWRKELVGKKRIELALEIADAAQKIRDEFKAIRNPTVTSEEQQSRLETIASLLQELYPLRAKARVFVSGGIDDFVDNFNAQYNTYRHAIGHLHKVATGEWENLPTKSIEEAERIQYARSGDNDFGREIDEITEKLTDFCRQHIAGGW